MSKQMKDTSKPNNIFHPFSHNNPSTNHLIVNQYSLTSDLIESNSETNDYKHNYILNLQKTAGNQVVQRLIKSGRFQTKLKVSHPSDPYEQEVLIRLQKK